MAKMFIVEQEGAHSALSSRAEHPPFNVASERQIYDLYMQDTGRAAYLDEPESRERVDAWLALKGWSIRPKTW